MKQSITPNTAFCRYYLSEYNYHDSESFVTLSIVDIDFHNENALIAVIRNGKLRREIYPLLIGDAGNYHIEHGINEDIIYLDDFEEAI